MLVMIRYDYLLTAMNPPGVICDAQEAFLKGIISAINGVKTSIVLDYLTIPAATVSFVASSTSIIDPVTLLTV